MRRSAAPFAVILAAAALVGLLVYGVAQKSDNRTIDDAISRGQRPVAPDRSLPALDGGGERSLASFKGKPVVLNFWASWCDPCKSEAPLLRDAQRRLTAAGGTVLGVTYRDAAPDSQAFVRRFRLTFPSVRDVDGKLARDYGTRGLPETFVIDGEGRVVDVKRGAVDAQFLDAALRKVGA